jgi:endoglucanase
VALLFIFKIFGGIGMSIYKGVSACGKLKVSGTNLTDRDGNIVILKGMSSHGMQWYPQFARNKSILATKKAGANVFRIAMYTAEGGYLTNPGVAEDVKRAADDALSLDMYAIIDWHILYDNDPLPNVQKAEKFFEEMSYRYRNESGIIYEICNEPNGDAVTWGGSVKPYAKRVIPVIRKNSPDAVVLVGSPTWSQDVDIAAADPLNFQNIMYTLHFYAGTHGDTLREKCLKALELGAPVFASEWGTSRADGSGGVYIKESGEWLEFLSSHNISWCNWSLGDRGETSAALLPGAPEDWDDSNLSESGRFVMSRLRD